MIPELQADNRRFWTGGADGRLHVPYCESCASWVLPPEADCPSCDGALGVRTVSGEGTVFTYTVDRHPFNPAVPPPYVIAIVELAEQSDLRVAANIVDCEPDSVTIGMPVAVRFEEQQASGETVYVPVFAPLGATS
ncbi:Zn-ribbon domain-containing OB-fold protein [Mycolicibacterium hodleri]|uniref:DNA-binding protein n=1 Tax=Mycolicibacterium hodleri TaxID=49897 RepID=A0A502E2A5_9MYCO|nr:OB-fold domain-containing protein [Mycolicibacterium hodleri]TPG31677.1 DNA-binding protein [Mycolicibacterium hodleri]